MLTTQPRGRPRKDCTWDTRTGKWIPTKYFSGIAPSPKKPKLPPKAERFTLNIALPQIIQQSQQSNVFDRLKSEATTGYDEVTEHTNTEEVMQHSSTKKKDVIEAYVHILFPCTPSYPVYYMDNNMNMKQFCGTTISDQTFVTRHPTDDKVYDELRDVVWPKLNIFTDSRKKVQDRLRSLNLKKQTAKHFMEDVYRKTILKTFIELHITNIQIRTIAAHQKYLLEKSWNSSHTLE